MQKSVISLLCICLDTGTDCLLFKINVNGGEQGERKKEKYLSLWEKKQCHVHYHRSSCLARGRKCVDQ